MDYSTARRPAAIPIRPPAPFARPGNARALAWFFAALLALWLFAGLAHATRYVAALPVVEYYNVILGHYFLTLDAAEIADIEAGKAGPGWAKTGLTFDACPVLPSDGSVVCLAGTAPVNVSRFYGTPGIGANSHFFTADAAEAAGLIHPGSEWTLERLAFAIDVPDPVAGCGTRVPVYRLYNNLYAFNDANHRYVTSEAERSRMVAKGWIDEGVRFCAYGAGETPVKSFDIAVARAQDVLPSAVCEDESIRVGPCLALNNFPVPAVAFPAASTAFSDRTGLLADLNLGFGTAPSDAAQGLFVQPAGATIGVHVDTRDRGASPYSSVNPLFQFHSSVTPDGMDARFFPFAPYYESEMQLAIVFTLHVKAINLAGTGSAAYGHPTIEFIDQRSGHHVYFTVLTYGTVPIADYLAPDVATGKVIVGTTFRADTPYGRSLGLQTMATPAGFLAPGNPGLGGAFEFRIDRTEFQRVIDAARTVDPALSADPADYNVDNFHFNNEVYGDGEIGLNIEDFKLEFLRR